MNPSDDDRLFERKHDVTSSPSKSKPAAEEDEAFADGEGSKPLESLAQQARAKQLNQARWILIVIGVLTLVLNLLPIFFDFNQGKFVGPREAVETELRKQVPPGMVVDPVKFNQAVDQVLVLVVIIHGSFAFLGLVFVILGIIVKAFPVPVTILGLVLYLLAALISGVLNAQLLLQGILIKILIVIALVKAVQAAIAYEREGRQLAESKPEGWSA